MQKKKKKSAFIGDNQFDQLIDTDRCFIKVLLLAKLVLKVANIHHWLPWPQASKYVTILQFLF